MSRSARRRALIIAGGSVLAGFALVAPAYAATSGHSAAAATSGHSAAAATSGHSAAAATGAGPRTPTGALVQPGVVSHLIGPRTAPTGARNTTTTSTNWSGYAAIGGTFTSVSSSWTQPRGTCSLGDQYSSFWVGLDGYSSNSVEQTGSEVDCADRTPEYYSWYEMYPANPVDFSNTVKPGDKFTGSVTYTGGSSFTLKLSDTTEGWSHIVTKTLSRAARSSAEVIAEAPCCTDSGGILPLADFGKVGFTDATADGSPIGKFNPVGIYMVSASGVQEDSISSLSSEENFSVTSLSSGNSRRTGPRG